MLKLRRDFTAQDISESEGGVFEIAFSSETPVVREITDDYGKVREVKEILVHDSIENADLSRLNNNAALLFNHDFNQHLGIVIPNSVRIDSDRIGRATVKFSQHGELAQEISAKVKEGTVSKISFGYDLVEYHLEGDDLFVTKWAPYEISFVTVPADDKVGLGRALNTNESSADAQKNKKTKEMKMTKAIKDMSTEELQDMTIAEIAALSDEDRAKREEAIAEKPEERTKREEEETAAAADKADKGEADELTDEEREEENEEILEIAERYKVPQKEVARALSKNLTARQFKRSIKPQASTVITKMNKDTKENLEKRYSLDNVARALAEGKTLRGAEAEYSQEMARKAMQRGRIARSNGAFIPVQALRAASAGNTTASLAKVTDEVVRYDSFVELLMEKSVLGQLNVNTLTGLKNPVAIPRMTSSSVDSFGFVSENGVSPEGKSGFDNIPMAPRTFTGGNPISRQSMLTVPNIGSFIADHIVKASRIKLEKMIFSAVANTNARDGLVKLLVDAGRVKTGQMTYKAFLAAVAELTDSGVDAATIKFVMRGALASDLKSTLRDSNVHDYIISDDNKLGGNDVISSGVVEAGSVIAGDFSGLTIAEWEGLELDLDDTTYRNQGAVVPRVWVDMDWAVTQPDSLVVMQTPAAGK